MSEKGLIILSHTHLAVELSVLLFAIDIFLYHVENGHGTGILN